MKKIAVLFSLGLVLAFWPEPIKAQNDLGDPKVLPEPFAGSDGVLDKAETVEFLIRRFRIPYADIVPMGSNTATPKSKQKAVDNLYWFLDENIPHPAPFTPAEILPVLPGLKSAAEKYEGLPDWQKVTFITEPYARKAIEYKKVGEDSGSVKLFAGTHEQIRQDKEEYDKNWKGIEHKAIDRETSTFGPFRLRREIGEITSNWVATENAGKSANITKIKGARIGYSDNFNIPGNGAWSTEGALLWPYHGIFEPNPTDSYLIHAALATSWKIEEQERPDASDINELAFSLPIAQLLQQDWLPCQDFGPQLFLLSDFYYHTDTGFDGEILGVTGSVEYKNDWFGRYFSLGRLFNTNEINFLGRHVMGKVRAEGLVDYSDVKQGSEFIARTEGDHWVRLGGEAGFDIGLFDFSGREKLPIEAGASYRYMETVSGTGDSSGLFKSHITLWMSDLAGFTFEYQNGQTPVADKDINLLTLGLEIRY